MKGTSNAPKHKGQDKDTKKFDKRNVTDTSKEAWVLIKRRKQPIKESTKVFNILDQIQPATSRKIATVLKIERSNITRCLKNLQILGKIKVVLKAKCPTTGMTVNHYSKIDYQSKEQGNERY